MTDSEFQLLTPSKMASLAAYYGLRQEGKKQLYVARKALTHPRTKENLSFKKSTRTPDLRLALRRASEWIDEWTDAIMGSTLPTLPRQGRGVTLGKIAEQYLRAATCDLATRKQNLRRLETIVEEMLPEQAFAAVDVDVLDGRLARQWLLKRKEEAERTHLPKRADLCEQAKRGANAIYRQGRCVFARSLFHSYDDAGLSIPPGTKEFAAQSFLRAAAAPPAEQLSAESLEKIVRLMPKLRTVRPAAWACLLLMFRGGLRNCEAVKARWSWILPTTDGGYVLQLHAQNDFRPKAKERIVRLAPELVAMLQSVRPPELARDDTAHLVPAKTDIDRYTACYRSVNKFLHACGVKEVKGMVAYRLRGHAITEIMLADGMAAAQEFAGHTSARTTLLYKGASIQYKALAFPTGRPIAAAANETG